MDWNFIVEESQSLLHQGSNSDIMTKKGMEYINKCSLNPFFIREVILTY